ncbi:MAG: NADP-binding protein, partial [Promethearchaeota archaeon]
MNKRFTVIQVGLGPMGKIITNLLLKRKNIALKGVIEIDPQLVGKKLNKIIEIKEESDLIIESDLKKVLSKERFDVVIIATLSSFEKIIPTIKLAVSSGCNVISICEELSYPFQYFPKLSEELHQLAKANNVTVVGTGINPGYLMD